MSDTIWGVPDLLIVRFCCVQRVARRWLRWSASREAGAAAQLLRAEVRANLLGAFVMLVVLVVAASACAVYHFFLYFLLR